MDYSFIDIPKLLFCLKSEHMDESFGGAVVGLVVRGDESECVVVLILLGHRVSVFPVDIHEDGLNHHSSMGVVENLLDIR